MGVEEWTKADYDQLIEREIRDGVDWEDANNAIEHLNMDKNLMEVCLKDLAKAKEKYEEAIEEQKDLNKVIENLELADDVAYHQATDFYGTIMLAQDFLNEEELKPYWIVWRKYYEE